MQTEICSGRLQTINGRELWMEHNNWLHASHYKSAVRRLLRVLCKTLEINRTTCCAATAEIWFQHFRNLDLWPFSGHVTLATPPQGAVHIRSVLVATVHQLTNFEALSRSIHLRGRHTSRHSRPILQRIGMQSLVRYGADVTLLSTVAT